MTRLLTALANLFAKGLIGLLERADKPGHFVNHLTKEDDE